MEYIIVIIISIISIFILKIGLNIRIKDIKKIKEIGYDKKLNEIANKFPENKEICEKILKKLNKNDVQIEENSESTASLYIALTNKIIIANIKDTFTRIQTIAHECLHSVQDRRILLFNFVFSNIYLLYFVIALFLVLFNVGNSFVFIQIFVIMTLIYATVRCYLENEAMSKAMYVAKEYMKDYQKENENIEDDEIDTLVNNFDTLNKVGIPLTNFYFISISLIKVIILSLLALT